MASVLVVRKNLTKKELNMKVRIGNPHVEDILSEVASVDKFSELEGWDEELYDALAHYLHGCLTNKAKHTSCVFLAWNELKTKERDLLLTLMDKRALAVLGLMCSEVIPRMMAKEGIVGMGIDMGEMPPELKEILKKAVTRAISSGKLGKPKEGDDE
jgi:hypothetical protein